MEKDIRFLQAQPALKVSDIEKSFAFYEPLGFKKAYQNANLHLLIEKDGVIVHLATRGTDGPGQCQIMVDNVDALYEKAAKCNMEMKFELTEEPWGCKDFCICDTDGNLVTFSQMMQ